MPNFLRRNSTAPLAAPMPEPPHPLGDQSGRQIAVPPSQHRRMFPPADVFEADRLAAAEQSRLATEAHEAKGRAHAERLASDEAARGRKVQVAAAAAASAANAVALLRNQVQGALNMSDTSGANAAMQELTAALAVEAMAKANLANARAAR